ncbi:MAG: sulfatase [Myxococcales bacterium]|nr:sulfatase [Myxococcota bacterium]MDW8281751.1 sulfatase [Myxococcales bacterium]
MSHKPVPLPRRWLPPQVLGALLCAALLATLACRSRQTSVPAPPREPVVPAMSEPPPLFDFIASRPLALVYEEEALVIEAAVPDVYKFMDGGWKATLVPGARWPDGRQVALADGPVAVLRVPLLGPPGPSAMPSAAAGAMQLQLWLESAPDAARQAMTVLLNERPIATLPVEGGAGPYRVAVPAGTLVLGENRIRLFFRATGTIGDRRSAAALERVALGPPSGDREQAPRPGQAGSFSIASDARPALIATRPTRWSYLLVPPVGPTRLHLALAVGAAGGARPLHWSLGVGRDGEPMRLLRHERVEPGRWQEVLVDLSGLMPGQQRPQEAGAALRLDLALDGPGALARPRLLGGPAEGGGDVTVPTAPRRAQHVVVVAVDALRADRVRRDSGDGFARLLRRGTRLPATSVSNYPLPAHASLLTGTYPAVHGLGHDEAVLEPSLPVLAEMLGRAGFVTGLFSGSGYVSERWGLSRGFDTCRNLVREGLPARSTDVWRVARPWLEQQVRAGRRAFLYMALADPHAPYVPPPGFVPPPALRSYGGPLRGGVTAQHLLQIRQGRLRPTAQDRAYLEALYDAEVAQVAATVGELLDALEALGVADHTAVALVGTHGEELFDHGSVGHGHSLYRELTSVPWVLSLPGRVPAAQEVPVEAELVDLAPTLLHLAGAAVPDSVQGETLVPLLAGGGMPRPALSQHGDRLRSLVLGRYKLVLSSGDRAQLFDHGRDPGEQRDVAGEHPIALRALRHSFSLLHALERRWHKARMGTAASLRADAGLW